MLTHTRQEKLTYGLKNNINTRQIIIPCNIHNKLKYTNCKADCLLALKKKGEKSGISFDALNALTGAENKPCL